MMSLKYMMEGSFIRWWVESWDNKEYAELKINNNDKFWFLIAVVLYKMT